jgi:membrane protease YdiL (CAAX protease family)
MQELALDNSKKPIENGKRYAAAVRLMETSEDVSRTQAPGATANRIVVEPGNRVWRWVFVGQEGLRAGWGILLFVLILGAGLGVGVLLLKSTFPQRAALMRKEPLSPVFSCLVEALTLLAIALATWVMTKIEGRTLANYGFGGGNKVGLAVRGFPWGVGVLSVLVTVLWKAGLLVFEGWQLSFAHAVGYGVAWLGVFVLVGLAEESLLRGYLQFTLARGLGGIYGIWLSPERRRQLGFWTAALLLSFVFGIGHKTNPGESPVGLISAGLFGLVCCLSLWRTGSLWWAIGIHSGWDWGQSFIFGVADSGTVLQNPLVKAHPAGNILWSGGATGPEGSLLILPTLVLIALAASRLRRVEQ